MGQGYWLKLNYQSYRHYASVSFLIWNRLGQYRLPGMSALDEGKMAHAQIPADMYLLIDPADNKIGHDGCLSLPLNTWTRLKKLELAHHISSMTHSISLIVLATHWGKLKSGVNYLSIYVVNQPMKISILSIFDACTPLEEISCDNWYQYANMKEQFVYSIESKYL